jgi:glutaredoxin-related protein
LNARTALGIEFVALDALRQAQARASIKQIASWTAK